MESPTLHFLPKARCMQMRRKICFFASFMLAAPGDTPTLIVSSRGTTLTSVIRQYSSVFIRVSAMQGLHVVPSLVP